MMSNLPPSAEEEFSLRARLKKKKEAMEALHDAIYNAQNDLNCAQMSTLELNQLSGRVRKALAFCDEQGLYTATFRALLDDITVFSPTKVVSNDAEPTHWLSILQPDISEKDLDVQHRTVHANSARVFLDTHILRIEQALRRQRLIICVKSTSLKIYSSAEADIALELKEISNTLGAVRRIPDEIWYEILGRRIARDSHYWPLKKSKGLFLPALSFSHVCSAWRRVIVTSPSMWKSIHWNLDREQVPNSGLLDLWTTRTQEVAPRIYERLTHSGVPTGGITHSGLITPTQQKLRYYIHQDRSLSEKLSLNQNPSDCSFLLVRASKSTTRVQKLQRRLMRIFPCIDTLCLEGIIPKRGISFPDSLVTLAIGFYGPHQTYPLADLLKERLMFLKLIHFGDTGIPILEDSIRLPNLLTLEITPLEHSIVAKLILPSIEKLRIIPQESAVPTDGHGWMESLIPLCLNLRGLSLDSLPISRRERSFPLDRLKILRYLRVHASRLCTLQFSDGPVPGSSLADFLETDKTHGSIDDLTLESCTGVSRMDCDRLVLVVGKLNVYRTFHGDGKIIEDQEAS